jgi:hypothetical protein
MLSENAPLEQSQTTHVCAGSLKPRETTYQGCRFRSRIEARWAVFFDNLGIKWWYEPEGFSLRYDYKEFVANWDFLKVPEVEPLYERLRQTFKHLDGKDYSYLPDFYLPELNYWIEVKGPNPNRKEIEKAFMLNQLALNASKKKIAGAKTDVERQSAIREFIDQGVYIIYGDIPWPFPENGNIFGYRGFAKGSVFTLLDIEPPIKEPEYRGLLHGSLRLCWQECPLCLKIGIWKIGEPFCQNCHMKVAFHIKKHLESYPVISEAGTTSLDLTKDLMNPEFFTSGHKSPRLQKSYSAARSARFEHGESP